MYVVVGLNATTVAPTRVGNSAAAFHAVAPTNNPTEDTTAMAQLMAALRNGGAVAAGSGLENPVGRQNPGDMASLAVASAGDVG